MNDLSAYIPEMIETRRYLHRIPEIAWTEFLTSELVIKRVRELGFKTIIGKHCLTKNTPMAEKRTSLKRLKKGLCQWVWILSF